MRVSKVFPTESALSEAAAGMFVEWAGEAIKKRGIFRAALSGGRGPRGLFAELSHRSRDLDWAKVELYWVDERWVPFASAESNFGEAGRIWLDHARPAPARFAMFDASMEPEAAAQRYADLLVQRFTTALPEFDLALLGMGPDGHTASLFPGEKSLDESSRLCLAVRQPSSGQVRLTLTLPVLNAARRCVFIVSGAEKAGLLSQVLAGSSTVPAARVQPQGGTLWLLDAPAASPPAP